MMILKFILPLVGLLLSLFVQAQVTNVTWALSPNQDKITIHYDLAPERFFDVFIEALLNGKALKPINLSGDVGKYLKGGPGKQASWDILRDNLELEGKLEIKVIAIDLLDDIAGKKPGEKPESTRIKTGGNSKTTALMGIALGLGSAAYGLSLASKSNDLYSIYEANRIESATVYQSMSREEHYQQANRKHKSSLVFLSTGGIAALYGVYQFIRSGGSNGVTQLKPSNFQISPSFTTQWHDQQIRLLPGAVASLRF
jgi:hypothetical protein